MPCPDPYETPAEREYWRRIHEADSREDVVEAATKPYRRCIEEIFAGMLRMGSGIGIVEDAIDRNGLREELDL